MIYMQEMNRRTQTIHSERPMCWPVRGGSCRSETRSHSSCCTRRRTQTRRSAGGAVGSLLLMTPSAAPRSVSNGSRTFARRRWIACALLAIATGAICVVSGDVVHRATSNQHADSRHQQRSVSTHTSNHAVIVSSSRYWFNYRHVINALSIYQLLRSNGIPDDRIVLMLADEYAINPRNPLPNQMLAAGRAGPTLYDGSVEIDYRGDDVRVESFLRVLTGRRRHSSSSSSDDDTNECETDRYHGPVLHSDRDSNVLIYLTGHGGDGFFKFQDAEEVLAAQLGAALNDMHAKGMYRHVLLMADTCQAFTLGDAVTAPNVTVLGSSLRGESSYAHHSDDVLGLSVIERYTHALYEFLKGKHLDRLTLREGLVDPYTYETQRAHVGVKEDTAILTMDQLKMSDFFADASAQNSDPEVVLFPDDDNDSFFFGPPSVFASPSAAERLSAEPILGEPPHRRGTAGNEERPAGNAAPESSWWSMSRLGQMCSFLFSRPGLEPTDPRFVALVTALVGSVAWSSTASTR